MSLVSDTFKPDFRAEAVGPSAGMGTPAHDATYRLDYAQDGVFVVVVYEDAGGRPLQPEVVLHDLGRRNIAGLVTAEVLFRIRRREALIRIADAQDEPAADSDIMVWVAQGEMSAEMLLLPPCGGGRMKGFDETLETIREKYGVIYGLDEQAVKTAVERRLFQQRFAVAAGTLPQKGEDGRIVFLFNTQHSYAPKIVEDGSADYKNLNIFEHVTEGATLVTATPPGEGVEGYTVKGVRIAPQKGQEAKLPKGKNVRVSEDGRSLIAAKSGRVDYINGRVDVADVLKIPGDVDMSIGNIQFDGDISISGNVISGLSIEATGTIEVWGYVEGATIIAGEDIVLKNGMQGMDKGKLIAGRNIVARFMERCDIEAKGSIFSDYIVQSKVVACGSIVMKGKWGRILGGVVRAGREISANIVGSPSNELTVIELGASPELRVRCNKMEAVRNQLKVQLDKINNVARVIPSNSDSPDRQEMRQKLISAKEQLQLQYNDTVAEIEALTQKLSEHSGARLHVFKSIFPNVKVMIDSCYTTTKSAIEFATFLYRDGEVVFTACEARP